MPKIPDDLKPKRGKYQRIKISEYNALVMAAQRVLNSPDAIAAVTGVASRRPSDPIHKGYFIGKSTVLIPPYSCFGLLISGSGTQQPLTVDVGVIDAADETITRLVLLTNDSSKITANGSSEIRVVGDVYPTRFRLSPDVEELPSVGEVCGPIDAESFVGRTGTGLACVAVEPNEEFCWAVATRETDNFMGMAAVNIDAMDGNIPGVGTISLWDWVEPEGSGDVMVEDTLQEVIVYNLSSEEIEAEHMLQGKWINGRRVIDFESCGAYSAGSGS